MVSIAYAEDTLHAGAPEGDHSDVAFVERFYVESGHSVQPGDPVALLRSGQYVFDLPADAAGTVADFLVTVGGTVEIGAPLIRLLPVRASHAEGAGAPFPRDRALQATPLARKIADARGLNLATVVGSGTGGRVRAADVWAAIGEQPIRSAQAQPLLHLSAGENAHTPAEPGRPDTEAQQSTIPRASTVFEVYIDAIRARQAHDEARHRQRQAEPTIADYIAHGALAELVHTRLLNSRWTDHGILISRAINLGIATGGSCPSSTVIVNAADLSPKGLALARRLAADDGHDDRYRSATADEATFVIRDDAQGAAWWTQAGCSATCGMILGVGQPGRVAAVVDGPLGATIVVRERVTVSAEYDARYLSQPEVDAFLRSVKQRVEWWAPGMIDWSG